MTSIFVICEVSRLFGQCEDHRENNTQTGQIKQLSPLGKNYTTKTVDTTLKLLG